DRHAGRADPERLGRHPVHQLAVLRGARGGSIDLVVDLFAHGQPPAFACPSAANPCAWQGFRPGAAKVRSIARRFKDPRRPSMAGHSKFKNIMHRKGRADSARSKLFSKLSREITVAAKAGLPDPNMNARLRLAVANAKAESMPKDVIDRAIKKASGGDADNY